MSKPEKPKKSDLEIYVKDNLGMTDTDLDKTITIRDVLALAANEELLTKFSSARSVFNATILLSVEKLVALRKEREDAMIKVKARGKWAAGPGEWKLYTFPTNWSKRDIETILSEEFEKEFGWFDTYRGFDFEIITNEEAKNV